MIVFFNNGRHSEEMLCVSCVGLLLSCMTVGCSELVSISTVYQYGEHLEGFLIQSTERRQVQIIKFDIGA